MRLWTLKVWVNVFMLWDPFYRPLPPREAAGTPVKNLDYCTLHVQHRLLFVYQVISGALFDASLCGR